MIRSRHLLPALLTTLMVASSGGAAPKRRPPRAASATPKATPATRPTPPPPTKVELGPGDEALPELETPPAPEEEAEETPPAAFASGIPVTVVQVAGEHIYLSPGTGGGVRRGAKVLLRRTVYTVVQATESSAAVVITGKPPREGDKGRATRMAMEDTGVVVLKKPAPLSKWSHAWSAPVPPASRQKPRFVPLGGGDRDEKLDVRLSAYGGAVLPLQARGSNLGRAALEARVHAAPFEAPIHFDVDLAVQRWFEGIAAREGAAARPTLNVRQLLVSYDGARFFGGLGRMRYAASTLGTLDGARAGAALGEGVSVAAFGGALPNPLSGAPSFQAQRFGVEATYSRPDLPLRPDAALVASGSTFDGGLDERRLSGAFHMYPGDSRAGGYFQLDAFDRNNPWSADPVELSAAGADASVRLGAFQVGGRFDARKPERSRWLASYLPPAWFCLTGVQPAGVAAANACGGSRTMLSQASLDAGIEVDRVFLNLSGGRTFDLLQGDAPTATFGVLTGRVVRIARVLRLDASAMYSTMSYLDLASVTAGPGLTLLQDALDVSTYYRGGTLKYATNGGTLVQQGGGATVLVVPGPSLLLSAQGEAVAGGDTSALLLFGAVTWRPH